MGGGMSENGKGPIVLIYGNALRASFSILNPQFSIPIIHLCTGPKRYEVWGLRDERER